MVSILKKDVLSEKGNMETSGRGKVNKIMDTITEKSEISDDVKSDNIEIKSPSETKRHEAFDAQQCIFSNEVLIEGESKNDLGTIRDRLRKELNPSNEVELLIVDRIVSSVWRLKRCLKFESQIIDYLSSCIHEYEQGFFSSRKRTHKEILQLKAVKIAEGKNKIEELYKYDAVLERQIYRALNELNKLRRREMKKEKRIPRRAN